MNTPGKLAHHVDYRRLATQQRVIGGDVPLSQLQRVSAELAADADTGAVAKVSLQFSEDAQRRVYVAGTIEAALRLVCQRCLRPFDNPMLIDVAGVVVGDDEAAANVPRADEPILAESDSLDVYALASDELLLALPSVARCDRADCAALYERVEPEPEPAVQDKPNNPFAALSKLKRDQD